MNQMLPALLLFAAMYVLLLIFAEHRWIIALCAAAVFMLLRILPFSAALHAINWNVLMMLAGTMATVELFIQSQMPARMAEQLLQKVPNIQWAVVALSVFSGVISAFVDNVATVLMVAPVGLAVARQLKTNPVPVIIAIAVSSNLQGAATLVGDTTSILLAGYVGMSFNDFFWFQGRLGIAWAVEIGAALTIPVLLYLFRHEKEKVSAEVTTVVTDRVPTVLLVGTVVLLIAASGDPRRRVRQSRRGVPSHRLQDPAAPVRPVHGHRGHHAGRGHRRDRRAFRACGRRLRAADLCDDRGGVGAALRLH